MYNVIFFKLHYALFEQLFSIHQLDKYILNHYRYYTKQLGTYLRFYSIWILLKKKNLFRALTRLFCVCACLLCFLWWPYRRTLLVRERPYTLCAPGTGRTILRSCRMPQHRSRFSLPLLRGDLEREVICYCGITLDLK